jgi:putative peptidoglycan lipid II flippase
VAAAAGWGVVGWLSPPTAGPALVSGMLAGVVVVAVFVVVAWALDRRDVDPMATAVRRRLHPRRGGDEEARA